jgi:hypothetical protein
MMFSIFRSHRNRFYWRNGKLYFIKQNRQQQQQQHQRISTPAEEQETFRQNIRQWFMFYSVLACIILAILIHRLCFQKKVPK